MANQSGDVYGLTILSPILQDLTAETSHNCAIRMKLASMPGDEFSPFAKVSSTHMARLVVMDDVGYVGMPSCEEHLKSQYLVFETDFDGELDEYLTRMAREIPAHVDALWQHCWGYPGKLLACRMRDRFGSMAHGVRKSISDIRMDSVIRITWAWGATR